MRRSATAIWEAWDAGGPFVGDWASHGRVTVDKDWSLALATHAGSYRKVPIRWFQRADNSQVETEVPNVKSIEIDRSIDTDAASATITLYNQHMLTNDEAGSSSAELGQPGYYSWRYRSPEAIARWGPRPEGGVWTNVLVPDALLRTYEGYGGHGLTIAQAVTNGNLVLTGVWLVDEVGIRHDGTIELKCRDMAKLLIEQHLYPPLVPTALYPQGLRYCRWYWAWEHRRDVTTGEVAQGGEKRCVYQAVDVSAASASDVWQGSFDAALMGHHPHDAFDGDDSTFWLSVGNISPEEPFAVEWIEAACGDYVDTVFVLPWAGNYRCYVSVMEDGAWVDGGLGSIDYDPAGVGLYTGANTAVIPFVAQAGVPFESGTTIRLPRAYRADKVRFTFSNLYDSQWGTYHFRAGVRRLGLSLSGPVSSTVVNEYDIEVQKDGNYKDYADIIKDLALWSGFFLYDPDDPTGANDPAVYGNIENTGIADTGSCLPEDNFDKKPVIDAMHTIRDIVGFLIWVDDEGAFRFESPNYYEAGNFLPDGSRIDFLPEIDERRQLTDYSVVFSDRPVRSAIIIASAEPTAGFTDTISTTFYPTHGALLRGIVRPMMLINGLLTDPGEQLEMARQIAIRILNTTVVGSVTCAANPCMGINDQARIHERVTSETGIHYIKGLRSSHDLDSGSYTMTLTTFRVGDETGGFETEGGYGFGWFYALQGSDVSIDPQGTAIGDRGPDGGLWHYGWHDRGGVERGAPGPLP